jgi:hypothetical protein
MASSLKIILDKTAQFKAAIAAMKKDIYVGVPSDKTGREGHIDNASLAYIHDKGSPAANIKARPFMEPGIRAVLPATVEVLKAGAVAAFSDVGAIQKSLNRVGLMAQASIKKTIVAGEGFQKLADSTIAARKRRGVTRTKPLIDTASMLNSISYVVK